MLLSQQIMDIFNFVHNYRQVLPGVKMEIIYPAFIQARDPEVAQFVCMIINRPPKAIYRLSGKNRKRILNILTKSANRFPCTSVKTKKEAEFLCKF
jgi:hypothetical protein